MSYTVLARRYRSGTFDEVVGQNHVAQTLKKAIASGRIAHAYLFCGTRGTGKTSTARILAKALNCERSDGPTTEPCGQCESCLAVARGDDIDVIEIDAASNTGVDNIRELIENSQYRPSRSRFKVYIIDEVHMLSKSAFNALLKTLEEPPSHVKFILATTEPEKVLPTILSRCQRYDFRNIPTREIAAHLSSVCKQEQIRADDDALLLVAKAGAGSMRDSLSLLDRLLSLGEKHLTVEMIEGLLGLPKSQLLFDLAEAIGSGDVRAVLSQTDAIIQSGLSVDGFLAALVDHVRNLLILNACGGNSDLVEVPGLSLAELAKQSQRFDAVTLAQDIAILEELRRQARQSNAGRALLDATLVRLALSAQFSSVADLLGRIDGAPPVQKKKSDLAPAPIADLKSQIPNPKSEISDLKSQIPNPKSDLPAPKSEIPNLKSEIPNPPSSIPTPPAPMDIDLGDEDGNDALPAVGRVWDDGPKLSLSTIMAQARKSAPPPPAPAAPAPAPASNVEPVDPSNLSATWQAILALLMTHGPAMQALLATGQYIGVSDGRAVVRYPKSAEMSVKLLDKNGKRELLTDAFSQVLNQSVGIRFEIDESAPTAPPATAAPARPAPRQPTASAPAPEPAMPATPSIRLTPELRAELETDPLIRAIIELGGNIVKVE